MAHSRKELDGLPANLKRMALRQIERQAGGGVPLTKAMQTGRCRPKARIGRIQHNRTWSELWKRWFDSELERRYADEVLWPRHKAGDITDMRFQVRVVLVPGTPGISWKVDFAYHCNYWGEEVHDEFKGHEEQGYKLKKKLWTILGPTRLLIHKEVRGRFECTENIWPERLPKPGEALADHLEADT